MEQPQTIKRVTTTPKQLLRSVVCTGILIFGGSTTLASEHPANDIAYAAMVLGLDATNLAAVGVTNTEVSTVLDALDEEYTLFQSLMTQQSNEANARRTIAEANARLRIDSADAQAIQGLGDAQAAAASAASTIATLKSQLLTEILDGVADSSLITPILLDESDQSRLPAPYQLGVDTDAEAKTLRWALRLETRVNANGGSLPSEATSALNSARAVYAYQAAKLRIETYGAANQTAIDSWISNN